MPGYDANSRQSFEDRLAELAPVVRAYAFMICPRGGDADDITQDALERAWRSRATYNEQLGMRAWLFTIVRRCKIDHWRRTRWTVADIDGRRAAQLTVEASQPWRIEYLDVLTALDRLDDMSREALMMAVAGLTFEQMSKALDAPVPTVKSRVQRARRRLARWTMP